MFRIPTKIFVTCGARILFSGEKITLRSWTLGKLVLRWRCVCVCDGVERKRVLRKCIRDVYWNRYDILIGVRVLGRRPKAPGRWLEYLAGSKAVNGPGKIVRAVTSFTSTGNEIRTVAGVLTGV